MHPKSETSEILSAGSPSFMSILVHSTNCMNVVQNEPLLEFFHVVFGIRQCVLSAVFV